MGRSEKQRKLYREHKQQLLRNREFREAFEEGLDLLRLGASVAALRESMNMSQAQLAEIIRTSQSVVSRLESGANVQIETLQKVLKALHAELRIERLNEQPKGNGKRSRISRRLSYQN